MNLLIVILGIVVVFLCYYIYQMYTTPSKLGGDNTYLGKMKETAPETIAPSSISEPYSSKYTIAYWIYVNTFSQEINKFLSYGKPESTTGGDAIDICSFELDNTQPKLLTKIKIGDIDDKIHQTITITDNLPIQSWVYVLVSVQSNYADCYINGKLVVSQQLKQPAVSIPMTGKADTPKPTFSLHGGPNIDVYITRMMRLAYPIDPQTVWNYYNQGNGNAMGPGNSSTYHLSVEVSKDDKTWEWKVF